MKASDIINCRNNGILYKAYTQASNRLSNPNTRPDVIVANTYVCNSFIDYSLKNSVNLGEYSCGTKTVSQLKFTTPPKVCPNINFKQGNNDTNCCLSIMSCNC